MDQPPLFKLTKQKKEFHIIMDSRMANIDVAAQITKDFLLDNKLNKIYFSTCLVLREALTNAVRHANKYDLSKNIFYSVVLHKNCLLIRIEDQGSGFDWQAALQKEYDKNQDHGRGMKIMQTYFDEVEFNEKGTIILLKKFF